MCTRISHNPREKATNREKRCDIAWLPAAGQKAESARALTPPSPTSKRSRRKAARLEWLKQISWLVRHGEKAPVAALKRREAEQDARREAAKERARAFAEQARK